MLVSIWLLLLPFIGIVKDVNCIVIHTPELLHQYGGSSSGSNEVLIKATMPPIVSELNTEQSAEEKLSENQSNDNDDREIESESDDDRVHKGPPTIVGKNKVLLKDAFAIRHERSRVRHSNEKENNLRAGADIDTGAAEGRHDHMPKNGSILNGKSKPFMSNAMKLSRRELLLWQVPVQVLNTTYHLSHHQQEQQPEIENGGGRNLKETNHEDLSKVFRKVVPTDSSYGRTTLIPVTHKIRKLHKKKIMESIRNSVGKGLGGSHLSKNHRSLVEAEQMQGRPTDVLIDNLDDDEIDLAKSFMKNRIKQNPLAKSKPKVIETQTQTPNPTPTPTKTEKRMKNFQSEVVESYESTEANKAGVPLLTLDKSASQEDLAKLMNFKSLHSLLKGDDDNDYEPPHDEEEDDEDVDYLNDEFLTTEGTTPLPKPKTMTTKASIKTLKLWPVASLDDNLTYVGLQTHSDIPKNYPEKGNPSPNQQEDEKQKDNAKDAEQSLLTTKQTLTKKVSPQRPNVTTTLLHKVFPNNPLNISRTSSDLNKVFIKDSAKHQDGAEGPSDSLGNNETNFFIEANSNVLNYDYLTEPPLSETTIENELPETHSSEPKQSASTSMGVLVFEKQPVSELEEVSFDLDSEDDEGTMDDGFVENRQYTEFPMAGNEVGTFNGNEMDESYDTNPFLAGAVDAANEDEIYDWDEISRNNRRNLMRGRDVVTKFLQIVETQHSLGSNCEAGTSLNLGEGVVDRYAQDRFRVEAEVAVNRANMLTRIFKMTGRFVQEDVNLLHASVLSMVEFDDDIFAAGNCFDWNEHPAQPGLFCPFAYRLPPPNLGAILAKDLATEYHYLGNTSEWFFQARKNAEKVIARNEQYLKAFHLYSNKTDDRIEDDTLAVKYEDGRWSKPYYDCGGGNIWMLTYTVPFFGYENGTYHFKGTSGIDIDLRRVDIDQCPQRNTPGTTQPLNIFAGTDKCKQRTTMCEAIKGLGFRRGSYKCLCRKGYYFPDTTSTQKFFNGSLLEEEYEKLMLGKNSTYNIANEYECLPCAEGCDSCEDSSPCIAALNWPMRTSILVLACIVIGLLPPATWFTFRYQQVKVVRAASPALLRVIALGAFFIYCTNIVMYPNPNLYTCTARIWLREIGFSLTYGALMLKTWRISVIFRVRSAKAIKITDAALLKRLGVICGAIGTCLLVRTLVSPPDVVVGRTADDLKAFLCKTDWWDYTFTSMEVLFLAWGVRLCIMVRKAPSEFNESRFISMAIYNEFLLTCFLNVSMLFLQSPANPDLLYIIFFCHTQLTVTLLLGLIFGSKVYIVLRSGKSHHEAIGLGAKASGAKFNFRPQVRTFANPSSMTTSTAPVPGTTSGENKLSDQEALEEIRQLSMQLQRIQEMAPPKGVAVMTISSLLDGLKTPGGMMMVAAAASQAVSASGNQLTLRQQKPTQSHPQIQIQTQTQTHSQSHTQGALPLLTISTEVQSYNQQLQIPQNNNVNSGKPNLNGTSKIAAAAPRKSLQIQQLPSQQQAFEEKAINTELTGEQLKHNYETLKNGHVICGRCYETTKDFHKICQQRSPPSNECTKLGSPQADGSLTFADIKLECMCSQSDDLDRCYAGPIKRVTTRSAATNTPPSTSKSQRKKKHEDAKKKAESSASLNDAKEPGPFASICDKCKNKVSPSKLRKDIVSTKKRSKFQNKSQTQSNDLLDRLPSKDDDAGVKSSKKIIHSTDDITFYSNSSSNESGSEADCTSDPEESSRKKLSHFGTSLTVVTSSIQALPETAEDPLGNASRHSSQSDGNNSLRNTENPPNFDGASSSGLVHTSSTNNDNPATHDTEGSSNGRSKRPDKLVLDLNDRSKYTKEVSV